MGVLPKGLRKVQGEEEKVGDMEGCGVLDLVEDEESLDEKVYPVLVLDEEEDEEIREKKVKFEPYDK